MPKQSAGILAYRRTDGNPEVLLVHPGGPFFAKKDLGAWSIPKGELDEGEDPLAAAKREFAEETGQPVTGALAPLSPVTLPSGKVVRAWAVEQDLDAATVRSSIFTMEWPPKSGRQQEFPEVDRAEWFSPDTARQKIAPGQLPLLEEFLQAKE